MRALCVLILLLSGCGHVRVVTRTVEVPVMVTPSPPQELIAEIPNPCIGEPTCFGAPGPDAVACMDEQQASRLNELLQLMYQRVRAFRAYFQTDSE